jgi:hypothetical protein
MVDITFISVAIRSHAGQNRQSVIDSSHGVNVEFTLRHRLNDVATKNKVTDIDSGIKTLFPG